MAPAVSPPKPTAAPTRAEGRRDNEGQGRDSNRDRRDSDDRDKNKGDKNKR
jgi:hypothetical protein